MKHCIIIFLLATGILSAQNQHGIFEVQHFGCILTEPMIDSVAGTWLPVSYSWHEGVNNRVKEITQKTDSLKSLVKSVADLLNLHTGYPLDSLCDFEVLTIRRNFLDLFNGYIKAKGDSVYYDWDVKEYNYLPLPKTNCYTDSALIATGITINKDLFCERLKNQLSPGSATVPNEWDKKKKILVNQSGFLKIIIYKELYFRQYYEEHQYYVAYKNNMLYLTEPGGNVLVFKRIY